MYCNLYLILKFSIDLFTYSNFSKFVIIHNYFQIGFIFFTVTKDFYVKSLTEMFSIF